MTTTVFAPNNPLKNEKKKENKEGKVSTHDNNRLLLTKPHQHSEVSESKLS